MELYKTSLIATFGHNSASPARAALFRCGGILLAAQLLGWLLAKGVAGLPVTHAVHSGYFVFTVMAVTQSAVILALLAALGITRISNADTFARLLLVLPVSQLQRWVALLLPSFVVAAVTASLLAWPLATVVLGAGLHPCLFGLGWLFGVVAGLGAVHGLSRAYSLIQIIGIPCLLWGQYKLVGILNDFSSSSTARMAACLTLVCLFGLLGWLFVRSSRFVVSDISRATYGRHNIGISLPTWLWFTKKIARARTTQTGFVTTLGMCTGAAILFHRYALDSSTYAMVAAVLAAAFVSDIRSLSRQHRPAEITALRATTRYTLAQIIASLGFGYTAVSPLLVGICLANAGMSELMHTTAFILFGISAGYFAGTVIAPAQRDVLGQLLATLMCLGILAIVSYIPAAQQLDTTGTTILQLLMGTLLLGAAWAIEYKRNTYKWRKSA